MARSPAGTSPRAVASRRALAALLALAIVLGAGRTQAEGTQADGSTAEQSLPPYIVNGTPTQDRPTTGAVLRAGSDALVGLCSGTLVSCRHVVTAAHCLCAGDDFASCGLRDPTLLRVYLQHAGILGVRAVDVHPGFVFGIAGDVAVLTLAAPVTGIRPTPINTISDPSTGMNGVIAGFGVTGPLTPDFGLLRHGTVTLTGCGAVAPEPEHVCWTAQAFVTPGVGANTCFGDSGGPLFVNFGGGDVLAGVTSGGTSGDCLPPDVSFEANVFRNRAFIEAIAGGDLASTTCGSIPQVGDPATQVTTVLFDGWSKTRRCRKEVTKRYTGYVGTKLKLMQKCLDLVNKGIIPGPCPEDTTRSHIERARARVATAKLDTRCPPSVIPTILAAGRCGTAARASELARCILDAGDRAVANVLDLQYANANPLQPIGDAAGLACQTAVARVMGRYGSRRLELLARCQTAEDKGRVPLCPDARTLQKLARLIGTVERKIETRCTDALIQDLNASAGFGGACKGVSSTAGLAACQIAGHDAETDAIFALLGAVGTRRRVSTIVPAGAAELRVTLNGVDDDPNDLDLFIRYGAPPTTEIFDARSANGGVFEALSVASPPGGTWYVLAEPVAGTNVAFQLTISTFPR